MSGETFWLGVLVFSQEGFQNGMQKPKLET
jgi:hypothetical protein